MAVYVTDEEQEKVILVGVELDPSDDCEKSLEELSELAKECEELGRQIGMSIRMQHEAIFNAMHNI